MALIFDPPLNLTLAVLTTISLWTLMRLVALGFGMLTVSWSRLRTQINSA